ncbi:hypothetical protein DFJ73DRAFT_821333 [Zopfochytrium polystomum]|nr:hypothetical protein DFJ73DRAFT_821333 [Zopfochytrium polystomum]
MSHLQSSFAPPISDTQRDKSPSPSKTAEIVQSGRLHVSKNGLSSAVDEVAMKSSDPASVASEGHSNPKRSSPEKPSDLAKKTDALQNLGASTPANVQENGVKLQIIQSSMQSGLTGVKPATAMEPRAGPFNPSGDARGVGRGRGLDPRRDTWPETSSLFISAGSIAPLLTAEPEDLEEDEPHTVSPPVAVSPSRSARSNHGSSERRASARLLKGAENSYEVTPRISNRTNQFKASDINRAQGHPSEEKPAVHSASDAAQSNGSDIPQPAPLENHIQAPPRSPSHKPVAKAEDAQEAHVFNYSSESQTALLQNTLSRRGSAGSASSSPNGFAFAPLHAEVSQFEREKADALRGDAKAAPVAQSTMQMPTEHLREFPIGSIPANSERMQFSDSLASAPPTRSPSSERRIDDARSVVPPLRSPSPKPIRESDKSKPNPSLGILAKVSKRTEVTTQNLRNDSVVAPPRSASPQPVNERDTRSVQPPPRSRNPQRISQLDAAQADEGSTFTQMKTAMQPPNTNIAGDTSVDTVKGMEAIKVTSTPPLNGALVAAPRRSLNPRPIDRTDSAERQIDRLGPDSGVKQQAFGTTNSVLVDDPASMRGANYQPNVRPEVGSAREHHDGVVVKAPPRSSSPRRLNGGDGHVRSAEVATVEPLAPKRSLSPRPVKVSERDLSNYQGSQSSNSELQRNVELKASPVDFTGDQSRRSREVPPDVNYLGASMIAPRRSRSPRPLLENHEKPPPRSQSPRPLSGVEGSSEFADTILYAVGETLVAPARSSRPVSLEARISVGSTGDGQTLPLPKRSNH